MRLTYRFFLLAFFALSIFSCSKDDPSDNEPGVNKSVNKQGVGTSAQDFLRDDNFTGVTLEIAYVQGFKPTQTAVNGLVDFISKYCHKPSSITIKETLVPATSVDSLDKKTYLAIEDENRTVYNTGDELGVWVFFADKSSSNDEGNSATLGTSYRNTSCIIYEKTLKNIANSITGSNLSKIESTTLHHEFGHLFGLVDLGTPMQTDHRDASQDDAEEGLINRHCVTESCLMYYRTVTNTLSMSMGNDIATLDDFCLADLRANRGK